MGDVRCLSGLKQCCAKHKRAGTGSCSHGAAPCAQAPSKHPPGRSFCSDALQTDAIPLAVLICGISLWSNIVLGKVNSNLTGCWHKSVFIFLIKPEVLVTCCAGDTASVSECQQGDADIRKQKHRTW